MHLITSADKSIPVSISIRISFNNISVILYVGAGPYFTDKWILVAGNAFCFLHEHLYLLHEHFLFAPENYSISLEITSKTPYIGPKEPVLATFSPI